MKDLKAYNHDYYLKNREKLRKKGYKYWLANRENLRREHHKKYYNQKKEIQRILGNVCVVCGKTKKLMVYHEIHGKEHPRGGIDSQRYILNHTEDFICMCYGCHKILHSFNKYKESFLKWMDLLNA